MPRLREPPKRETPAQAAVEEHLEDQGADTGLEQEGDTLVDLPEAEDAVDHEAENASLKQQLETMKRNETDLRRQAEEGNRAREDADRRLQERQQELARSQKEARDAEASSVESALAAAKVEADSAEQDIERAAEVGDFKAQAQAQRRLAVASSRIDRLEEGKAAIEARAAQPVAATQTQEGSASPSVEQVLARSGLPAEAKSWLRKHSDYLMDARKNAKIQSLHYDVMEDGVAPFSAEYFERIEEELGMKQKAAAHDEADDERPVPAKKQAVSVQAPVSREVPNSNGQRPTGKVRLTPAEYDHAKAAGVTPEVYMANKLKLKKMRDDGEYGA